MAATIKIKRSGVTVVPQNLATAELAYSWEPSTGGVLYIGTGPEANNVAQSIDVIGGKYFTDKLDHSPGIVTSNSAIIVDDANRIDSLNIGFVTFSDNTITTQYYPYANTIPAGVSEFSVPLVIQPLGGAPIDVTNSIITNVRTPDAPTDAANKDYVDQEILELRQTTNMQVNGDVGTGTIVLNSEIFTISGDTGITTNMSGNKIEIDLDDTAVTPGSYGSETEIPVFTVDQQGRITLANTVSIATDLSIAADEGIIDSVFLLDDVLTFSGQTAITTSVSDNEILIDLDDTEVTPGSYGSETEIPVFTVDQQGRLTEADTVSIATALNVSADTGTPDQVFLLDDTLAFVGDTGITTNVSNNQISIDLDDTAVTPGSYGSQTEIPVFTVDQQGRITLANTVTIATDLSIGADEGTIDSVFLLDDILTFSGQTGITTTVADNEILIDLDDTSVTPGTYGSQTEIPVFTVDQQGRLTSANTVSVAGALTIGADTGSDDQVFLLDDTLVFVGDTGITTNVSNNQISIDLDDTAVVPGSYGSQTDIPVFTVDQQGRLTSANTVSVAGALTIDADSGISDQVFLLDDTLSFVGQTGITTFVSNNEIGINLDDTAVTAASYGSQSTVPFFIVNQQGRLTNASDISIQITKDQITDFAEEVQDVVGNFVTGDANSGISVAYADSTNDFTISAENATTSTKGVAQFAPDDFVVNNGEVELSDNVIKEIETDSGTFTPSDGSFAINGGEGIDVFSTNTAIIVSGEDASDTNKGIASFDATNFTANNGNVTSNPITLGSTGINLGNIETNIEGLDLVEVGTLRLDTNTISSTANNENIVLDPNGTGIVSVENSRITGVSNPISDLDAVNKRYVDDVAQGLTILPSAEAATTVDLGGIYSNGSNATITIANTEILEIDGVTSWEIGDNVLVKDQTDAYENGSYFFTQLGSANNSFEWIIQRCSFCDEEIEIPGSFEFVTSGTEYVNTGWVTTVPSDFEFGSSDPSADPRFTTKGDIVWVQFSGAGTFIAGDGLSLTGNEFSVNVDDTTIEIVTDTLRVKNSGITNAKLANPFVSIAAETGSTDQVNLGETLTFAAGEGINTTVSDNQILIASEDATLTNKGAASFGGWADDGETVRQFSVTSGDVRVEAIDGGTY